MLEIYDPVKDTTHVYYRFMGEDSEMPYCEEGMERIRGLDNGVGSDGIDSEGDEDEMEGQGEEEEQEEEDIEQMKHIPSGVNDILIIGEVRGLWWVSSCTRALLTNALILWANIPARPGHW